MTIKVISGVELKLMPMKCSLDETCLSDTLLEVEPDRELVNALSKRLKKDGAPITESFWCPYGNEKLDCWEEAHWGECKEDPYGSPLKSLTVKQLLEYKNHRGVRRHPVNVGIWKYLEELEKVDPESGKKVERVALYFH